MKAIGNFLAFGFCPHPKYPSPLPLGLKDCVGKALKHETWLFHLLELIGFVKSSCSKHFFHCMSVCTSSA